ERRAGHGGPARFHPEWAQYEVDFIVQARDHPLKPGGRSGISGSGPRIGAGFGDPSQMARRQAGMLMTVAAQSVRILSVDDNQSMAQIIPSLLRGEPRLHYIMHLPSATALC